MLQATMVNDAKNIARLINTEFSANRNVIVQTMRFVTTLVVLVSRKRCMNSF